MARYFSADTHFRHANILKYCALRGDKFKDIKAHDAFLTLMWNKMVKNEDDDIFILGDFAFADIKEIAKILKNLRGKKHLILGNHDNESWKDYIDAGFETVQRFMFINVDGIGAVGLAHDPSVCIVDRSAIWCCGHLHDQFKVMGNCVNVGLDVNDFSLISEEKLVSILEKVKRFGFKVDRNIQTEFNFDGKIHP